MSVAMIERKLFGGTCVNTGCMPTKALVASAHAAHIARHGADFGVRITGAIDIDMKRSRHARTRSRGTPAPMSSTIRWLLRMTRKTDSAGRRALQLKCRAASRAR